MVSQTGICQSCLEQMVKIRSSPDDRKRRLGELNQSENGIRMGIRRSMHYSTSQRPLPRQPFAEAKSERAKAMKIRPRENIQFIHVAAAEDLSKDRDEALLTPKVTEINAELMRYIAKHPEFMHKLPPRKFEELVAEILLDRGHQAWLTKATRDGGWDVYAEIATPIGKLLVIVECKKWALKRKVGLSIVERFLHTIREKTRASIGMIAATTTFSQDARICAAEYQYQLKLADLDKLRELASQYGCWHRMSESELWVPDYATTKMSSA